MLFITGICAAFLLAACNSDKISESDRDSTMTDSATIGMDTSATGITDPVPYSDTANTGLDKSPPKDNPGATERRQ